MKRNKRSSRARPAALALAVLMALGLAGCRLARPETEPASAGGDTLIGIYVTEEYLDLFDMEAWLEDNAGALLQGGDVTVDAGDSAAYGGRLYAENTLPEEAAADAGLVFPGVSGQGLYVWAADGTDGTCLRSAADDNFGGTSLGVHTTDEGGTISISATLYRDARSGYARAYFNPVYRAADGRIYLTAGQGIHADDSEAEGSTFGYTCSETETRTVNDRSEEETVTVNVQVEMRSGADRVRIIELDAALNVLVQTEYAEADLPEKMTLSARTRYVLVEEQYTDRTGAPGSRLTACSTDSFMQQEDGAGAWYSVPLFWYDGGAGHCGALTLQTG